MHLGAKRAEAVKNTVASKLGYPEEVGSGGHEKLYVGRDTTAPAKKGTVIKSDEEEKRLGGFSDPRLNGAMNVESFNGEADADGYDTDIRIFPINDDNESDGDKVGEEPRSTTSITKSGALDSDHLSATKLEDATDCDVGNKIKEGEEEFDKDGDEDAMRLEGDGKMAQELKADNDDVRDTGWFFVCNQSYTTTEEELMEHSSEFKRALEELDNSIFQGKLLNVLPAKPRETSDKQIYETTHLPKTFKQKKEEQRKVSEAGGNTKAWNSLFMRPDTILENIVRVYGVSKSELLDRESDDPAVSLVLGETKVIAETKEALAKAGVNVVSLEEFATWKAFKTDGVKKKVRKKKEKKKKKMYLKNVKAQKLLEEGSFFVEKDEGGRRSRVQTYDEQEEVLRRAVTDAVEVRRRKKKKKKRSHNRNTKSKSRRRK